MEKPHILYLIKKQLCVQNVAEIASGMVTIDLYQSFRNILVHLNS